ncbi:MAG: hypothetical protein JWR90_2739 [Marmoricola sp.]|nr:hypothetical protein [Marmoricola sp.]
MRPEPAPPSPPSRRTLIRAAAWSVPLISLAAAAPAYAASGDGTVGETSELYDPSDPAFAQLVVQLSPAGGPPLTAAYFTCSDAQFILQNNGVIDYADRPQNSVIVVGFERQQTGAPASVFIGVNIPGYQSASFEVSNE